MLQRIKTPLFQCMKYCIIDCMLSLNNSYFRSVPNQQECKDLQRHSQHFLDMGLLSHDNTTTSFDAFTSGFGLIAENEGLMLKIKIVTPFFAVMCG